MTGPIAIIRKNKVEEVRVSIDEFHGHRLVNLRVWYNANNGEMRPGKQGLALRVDLLPELLDALKRVRP
jgi:hypothetical protein